MLRQGKWIFSNENRAETCAVLYAVDGLGVHGSGIRVPEQIADGAHVGELAREQQLPGRFAAETFLRLFQPRDYFLLRLETLDETTKDEQQAGSAFADFRIGLGTQIFSRAVHMCDTRDGSSCEQERAACRRKAEVARAEERHVDGFFESSV